MLLTNIQQSINATLAGFQNITAVINTISTAITDVATVVAAI